MNSHRLAGLLTAVALLAMAWPSLASAADGDSQETNDKKAYVEYRGGLSVVRNQNLTGADQSGSGLSGSVRPEEGFTVGGALGIPLTDLIRAEVSLDYRLNKNQDAGVGVGGGTGANGDVSLLTVMSNVYIDYDIGVGVIPFAGAGIGWGYYRIDSKSPQVKLDDTDSLFAWNVMIGGTYPFTQVTDVSLGYRYLATEDPEIKSTVSGVGKRRLDTEYDSHEVFFALRFKF